MACQEGSYEPVTPPTTSGGDASGQPSATGGDADASTGGGGPGPPAAGADAEPVPCEQAVASPGNGEHHAGDPCLTCHDDRGGAPRWTLAGTAYTALTGGAPLVGASIVIVDASGAEHTLTTKNNGNFWTAEAIPLPVTVRASRCPDTLPMIAPVSDGDCNGCHGASLQIWLP